MISLGKVLFRAQSKILVAAAGCFLMTANLPAATPDGVPTGGKKFAPPRGILVRFKPHTSAAKRQEILRPVAGATRNVFRGVDNNLRAQKVPARGNLTRVDLAAGVTIEAAL